MKCTKCKKELEVGDWFCVARDCVDDVSLPFCSFDCQGKYFTSWWAHVTEELLNKWDSAGNDDERQTEILEDEQW